MNDKSAVEQAEARIAQARREGRPPDPRDAALVADAETAPVPSALAWLRGRAQVPEEAGDPKEAVRREELWGDSSTEPDAKKP